MDKEIPNPKSQIPNPQSEGPLVSVVMIFLNGEAYMGEAVESVRAQTYGRWELVLVDDGSTDGSEGMARAYAEREPERIRYLTHPGRVNRGMSASRNLGMAEARGAYLAFLDADDVYRPEKLARQVAILHSQPEAAMVFGATQHWYSWSGREEDKERDSYRRLGVQPETLVQPPGLVRLFMSRQAQTPGTCGVLLRREAAEAVGGFEERFRGMYEDQVFFYKLCLRFPVYVEGGSWDRYRQHPASVSRRALRSGEWRLDGRPNEAIGFFLAWLEGYLREQQVTDEAIWQLLYEQQWPYRHPVLAGLKRVAGRVRQLALRPGFFVRPEGQGSRETR
jgi:glycosyltransferase involved in cell wall biosynthesis